MVSTWLNGLVSGTAVSGAGYFGGGYTSGVVTTVDKFAFSDDGRTTLGTGLSAGRDGVAGMAMAADLRRRGWLSGNYQVDVAIVTQLSTVNVNLDDLGILSEPLTVLHHPVQARGPLPCAKQISCWLSALA